METMVHDYLRRTLGRNPTTLEVADEIAKQAMSLYLRAARDGEWDGRHYNMLIPPPWLKDKVIHRLRGFASIFD